MGKLYFKKLFSIILFAFCILGVFFISYSILATVSNFFKHPAIRYTILMGVPTFFVLRLVNKGRIKNQNLKIDYMNYLRNLGTTDLRIDVKNESNSFKTFKPLHAEVLAVATLLLPFVITIGFSTENEASIFVNFLIGLVIFSLFVGIYAVADIALWILVHKNWLK